MTRAPSVTVVVPTRGRPELLERAVASVLEQRYDGAVECLVVFDAEEPGEVAAPVAAHRGLRLLANARAAGPAGARNTGLLAADGHLVALCDDDDAWHPDKLRRQVTALTSASGAIMVTCGVTLHGEDRSFARVPDRAAYTLDDLLASRRAEVHTSTLVAHRAALLDRVGLIDEAIPAGYGEDYDYLVRTAAVAPIVAVEAALVDVTWTGSWFADQWGLIIEALSYQLAHRPELRRNPANLARMNGRLAFAHAALGHAREARSWALRAVRQDWRQPRGYLALLVTAGVSPDLIVAAARRRGRGI